MKYLFTLFLTALISTYTVFSQAKNTTHKVEKGETITQIAQKYNITPHDIYLLNPDAQSGLKPNSILLIPNKASKVIPDPKTKVVATIKTNAAIQTHRVETKETLFGIEKKYGVSDEALKKANPELEELGLQIGQVLVIPSNIVSKTSTPIPSKIAPVYHEVLPKESKYSIAQQYGITVEEIERKNPEVIPNLPIGYKLLIKGNAPKAANSTAVEIKKEIVKPSPIIKGTKKIEYAEYEVKSKETLYSLSKKLGMSQEELIALNPDLSMAVNEGMILKVPSTTLISQETKKETTSLSRKNGNSNRKKLVLLLPFNVSKIESDTINSTAMRLKKDKFLNMTLDFYSGALMAIDSARSIGIPVDIRILDSQETKTTSNILNLIQENNLENADAVVGPFYQSNVEKTAEILGKNNVPVISPLSKDIGNPFANLYQTIPTTEVIKKTMFDFMMAKSGNIIAVIDKKKESVRQYIKENQKEVQFAALQENGSLSVESLKSLFVKNKINYVVLETANTVMIKATMNAMLGSMVNYKVQLVILSANETLDTDEIDFGNLVKLKLMYPSVTRENNSPEAWIFKNEYRKKNYIFPTAFATRGFDVTFDTLMRLSQDKNYQDQAAAIATEQVDNKFEFYKKTDGGYANKGVYILYYDTDLTIKEAN